MLVEAGFAKSQLYTADGADEVPSGALPDLPVGINFGGGDPGAAAEEFAKLKRLRPNGPFLNSEFWDGWFTHWGSKRGVTNAANEAANLDWMLRQGYSVSFYMFLGGTSFGWMNGANSNGKNYEPDVTSYDYDAPLDESGHPTPKYFIFRDVIAKATGIAPPPVPTVAPATTIPEFQLNEAVSLWSVLPSPVHSEQLLSMEDLDQAYGCILTQQVTLAGKPLLGWDIYPLPMAETPKLPFARRSCIGPCFYRGFFHVKEPADTFLDTRPFHKGALWLNGRPLGRTWSVGPQQTLYAPDAFLQPGMNSVVVFELNGHLAYTLNGRDQAILDLLDTPVTKWPLRRPWLPPSPPNATILGSMTPTGPNRPRIGIPWRTSQEEVTGKLPKIRNYLDAIEQAGGEAMLLSLAHPEALHQFLAELDGFVLPGSPSDVNPAEYGASNRGKSEPPDQPREETDRAILGHAFAEQKPVLAICYGCQLLNVFLGGTLIQDLRSETGTTLPHRKKDLQPEPPEDPCHDVRFTAESQLAKLAGSTQAIVNSSHHQSIAKPGRQLRITGQAADGIVECVEWTGDANWVIGVQWHPERMGDDTLAHRLFSKLVAIARGARKVPTLES
jgi:gamma-glutamyl-gamma-aminobutyrate hydrolase PuuD